MALVCLGLMALTTVGQTSGKKGTWKLVWQEEFDNKAGFDTTSWSKIPRGTADWNSSGIWRGKPQEGTDQGRSGNSGDCRGDSYCHRSCGHCP